MFPTGGAKPLVPPPCSGEERVLRDIRWLLRIFVVTQLLGVILAAIAVGIAFSAVKHAVHDPRVEGATNDVVFTLSAARNISGVVAAATQAGAANMGLLPPPPAGTSVARHLLALQDSPLLNSTLLQAALANLADQIAEKVSQTDASAPGNLVRWIVSTNWTEELGPYVRELLGLVRYGEAAVGTLLGSFGTKVDPSIVGPTALPPPSSATHHAGA